MSTQSLRSPRPPAFGLRMVRIVLCAAVVAFGLALRRYGFGIGLPALLVKYGGSALWAVMVFLLVGAAAVRAPRPLIASVSVAIAVGVELFRLVHTPLLDAFRLTLAGALLLGRIFSPWDIVAYGAGIVLAMLIDRAAGAFVRSAYSAS